MWKIRSIKKGVKNIFTRLTFTKYDYSQEQPIQEWGQEIYPGRYNWESNLDSLGAQFGFILGLSTLYFFPITCLAHGKVLFLIPYLVSLLLVSTPLILLETALGQYTSKSSMTCWNMAPALRALGIGMLIITVPTVAYFILNVALSLHYVYHSFIHLFGSLPWMECGHSFNTEWCSSHFHLLNRTTCVQMNMMATNSGICYNGADIYGVWDNDLALQNHIKLSSPASEYFSCYLLDIDDTDTFEDTGAIRWETAVLLGSSWLLVFLVLFAAFQIVGKVASFGVAFAAIIVILILGFIFTQSGAFKGIEYFLTDLDWSVLYKPATWKHSARLAVFSTGAVGGHLIVLTSYNSFHNNLLRDAAILTFADTALNIIGTLLLCALVGCETESSGVPLNSALGGGFVVFGFIPQALGKMSTIITLFYFFAVFLMGFCSTLLYIKCVVTSVADLFPKLHKPKYRRLLLTLFLMVFGGIGIPICTESGFYAYYFLESYASGGNLLFIGFLECISLSWLYGIQNLRQDVGLMIGSQRFMGLRWNFWSQYFAICWVFVSPVCLFALVFLTYSELTPLSVDEYQYPNWSGPLGLLVAGAAVLGILASCLFSIVHTKGNFREKLRKNFTQDVFWGPALVKHRVKVVHLNMIDIDPHWQGSVKLAHEV